MEDGGCEAGWCWAVLWGGNEGGRGAGGSGGAGVAPLGHRRPTRLPPLWAAPGIECTGVPGAGGSGGAA